MDIPEQYRGRLKTLLEKRFSGFDVILRDTYSQVMHANAIDFVYKGVECLLSFYDEEGKLVFMMDLETPQREGLVDRIQQESPTNKRIEKSSRFLSRPHKEVTRNSETAITHYSIHCGVKSNLRNIDPQKHPDNADKIVEDIWGYLMKVPIGLATGILK